MQDIARGKLNETLILQPDYVGFAELQTRQKALVAARTVASGVITAFEAVPANAAAIASGQAPTERFTTNRTFMLDRIAASVQDQAALRTSATEIENSITEKETALLELRAKLPRTDKKLSSDIKIDQKQKLINLIPGYYSHSTPIPTSDNSWEKSTSEKIERDDSLPGVANAAEKKVIAEMEEDIAALKLKRTDVNKTIKAELTKGEKLKKDLATQESSYNIALQYEKLQADAKAAAEAVSKGNIELQNARGKILKQALELDGKLQNIMPEAATEFLKNWKSSLIAPIKNLKKMRLRKKSKMQKKRAM